MTSNRILPDDPLKFIADCVSGGRVFWTYHVAMRLGKRSISREAVLDAVPTYEMIERYPDDKYLPSYLIRAESRGDVLHILFAADVAGSNVRVVTAYRPNPGEWDVGFRRRKRP